MVTEINEEFLIEYVDGVLRTIAELHTELRKTRDEFNETMLFGLRTALFQLQTQLIVWHPNIDNEQELLERFHLNFEIEMLLDINKKVPYVE